MPASPFYHFPHKGNISRESVCSFCQDKVGALVGRVNYFGLQSYNMVQCPSCGLTSIDSIPTEAIVREGCTRLYASQVGSEDKKKIIRGFGRSYRRGALFARSELGHLNNQKDLKILEIGPGDGYFSRGIKSVYPEASIYLVDVVRELLQFYRSHHDCTALTGEFSTSLVSGMKFDIILFRDLLEHVRDPFQFLKETAASLKPQGEIFFITPNGREDFWSINQRFIKTGTEAVMLLNHFHYFLPETLEGMLRAAGFTKRDSFKFGLKQHRQGHGVQEWDKFTEDSIPQVDTQKAQSLAGDYWGHDPALVTQTMLNRAGIISRVYSRVMDIERERTDFFDPIGHEFYVIARKET